MFKPYIDLEIMGNRLLEVWGAMLGAMGIGYIPTLKSSILGATMTQTDTAFQHAVWSITIIVGLFAIVAGIQKQRDRYRSRKNHK